ncbi:hypothetical protein B1B_06087 [mine drainage metagenome]|uniref:Uncharacterized protein n=2 Tax=mine drainage metagenome TaxID=410659 RepID=T1CHZ5_9ZZZZ
MVQLYAVRFDIPGDATGDGSRSPNSVDSLTRSWIGSWYRRWKNTEIVLPEDFKSFEPMGGHRIQAASDVTEAGESCWALIWSYPHPEDESLLWQARIVFAQSPTTSEFALTLQLDSREMRFRPPELNLRSPRLVGQVASSLDCKVGPDKVVERAVPLRTAGIDDFVEHRLLNAERRLPAVTVSRRSFDEEFVIDPDRLARRLVGLAVVYSLSERGASYRLTDLMPPKLSCYNGAVRIYWPGFSRTDPPTRHPLYHPDIISRILLQGYSLEDRLFERLARVSAFRYVDGPITTKVLQASKNRLRERQAKQLEVMRVELGEVYGAKITELQVAAAQREEYVRSLEDEIGTLKERLSDWRLYQAPDAASVAAPTPTADDDDVQSVAEAVAKAKSKFSDSLEIWPSALESATRSESERYESVYQALEILHRIAFEYFGGAGSERGVGRFEDSFSPYRIKYSARESQTTGQNTLNSARSPTATAPFRWNDTSPSAVETVKTPSRSSSRLTQQAEGSSSATVGSILTMRG